MPEDDTTFFQRHKGKTGTALGGMSVAGLLGLFGWMQTHLVWKDDYKESETEQKQELKELRDKVNSLDKQLEVLRNIERKRYE